ncbi:hypothetical protein CEXT_521211 [Caerostris extrusa]|uniref:Ycf15 n=1 Tax=Caerostris extrusa TaxID=172846 RepID=A0AAV4WAS9_CAEEX|nr:hypothetical protein CEXT_521211 [Caerostris extrusa]
MRSNTPRHDFSRGAKMCPFRNEKSSLLENLSFRAPTPPEVLGSEGPSPHAQNIHRRSSVGLSDVRFSTA